MGLFGFTRQSKVDAQIAEVRREVRAAHKTGYLQGVRNFNAASESRLLSDWKTQETQIQQLIKNGFVPVRERARELERNNDTAKRFLKLGRTNIVNQTTMTGFTLQPWARELSASGELVEFPQDDQKITSAWEDWAKPENASVNGQHSLRGILDMTVKYLLRDGEAFLRIVRRKKMKYGLCLQIIPPELVDESYNARLEGGNIVQLGVEYDVDRRPIAYWLKVKRPEAEVIAGFTSSWQRERVDASEMIHLYDPDFVNQARGISWMVQSMVNMHYLGKYDFAALVNATISASKMFWITNDKELAGSEGWVGQGKDGEGNTVADAEAGSGEELAPGQDVVTWDPKYPDAQHEMFSRTLTRKTSSGLGISYASLSGDLSQANYGSNRVGMVDEREYWKLAQQMMIEKLLLRLYPVWLEMAWLKNLIQIESPYAARYQSPLFIGRIWGWIDPESDMNTKKEGLNCGLETLTQSLAEKGIRLEEQLKEIKTERDLAKKMGIELDFSTSGAQKQAQNQAAKTAPANGAAKGEPKNGVLTHTN